MNQVVKLLEDIIQVNGPTTIPMIDKERICQNEVEVPDEYKNGEVTGDLLLFVKMVDESSDFLAFALPCA